MGKIAKDSRIFFRLTQERKEMYTEDAKKMGCKSLSGYIRLLLNMNHKILSGK